MFLQKQLREKGILFLGDSDKEIDSLKNVFIVQYENLKISIKPNYYKFPINKVTYDNLIITNSNVKQIIGAMNTETLTTFISKALENLTALKLNLSFQEMFVPENLYVRNQKNPWFY